MSGRCYDRLTLSYNIIPIEYGINIYNSSSKRLAPSGDLDPLSSDGRYSLVTLWRTNGGERCAIRFR